MVTLFAFSEATLKRDYQPSVKEGVGSTYDRFLHEQLAGDELIDYENVEEVTQEVVDTLAATGFMRLTPDRTYASCPDGETSLDLSTSCRAADAHRVPRGTLVQIRFSPAKLDSM